MHGALARRVLHCLPTAGPAGIYACGAGPTTKAPMNVSAGHSVLPSGEHAWSAVFSPGIPCLSAWGEVNPDRLLTTDSLSLRNSWAQPAADAVDKPFPAEERLARQGWLSVPAFSL